ASPDRRRRGSSPVPAGTFAQMTTPRGEARGVSSGYERPDHWLVRLEPPMLELEPVVDPEPAPVSDEPAPMLDEPAPVALLELLPMLPLVSRATRHMLPSRSRAGN